MKPSTALECVGFAVIVVASWRIDAVFGMFVAGFVLLLIGYAFDDSHAAMSFRRAIAPIARRHAEHKSRRAVRSAKRKAG